MSKRQKIDLSISACVIVLASLGIFSLQLIDGLAQLSLESLNKAPDLASYVTGLRIFALIHDLSSKYWAWTSIVFGLPIAQNILQSNIADILSNEKRIGYLDKAAEILYDWMRRKGIIKTTQTYTQFNISLTNTISSGLMKISGRAKRYA